MQPLRLRLLSRAHVLEPEPQHLQKGHAKRCQLKLFRQYQTVLLLHHVVIDAAQEGDQITQMNGKQKDVPVGDMLMRDAKDVACTILRGQDNRSPISKATTHVLYVSYAPQGVTEVQVQAQLDMMEKYVRMVAPNSEVEQNSLICAKP